MFCRALLFVFLRLFAMAAQPQPGSAHSVNVQVVLNCDKTTTAEGPELAPCTKCIESASVIASLSARIHTLEAENKTLVESLREHKKEEPKTQSAGWSGITLYCSATQSGTKFHVREKCAGRGACELTMCNTCCKR